MADVKVDLSMDLFVGSNSSYNDYKRQHNIEDTPEEREQKQDTDRMEKPKTILSKSTLKNVSEEDMRILRRTRCAHSYHDVYMQSSLDFYDKYYNDDNASPELKRARQIRRVYRSYSDYLNAIEVRNAYIDTIVDKYGEVEFNKKLTMGILPDWIPPLPILSKSAEDYEMYLAGINPLTICETLPEGTIKKVFEAMQEDTEDVELIETCSAETLIGVIKEIQDAEDAGYGRSVSASDLEELNRVFRSWYKKDSSESSTSHEIFKNAPENIRRRFEEARPYEHPGLLTKIARGEDVEEEKINLKEMVHDSVTGRTMTRQELMNRETIRLLANAGWSDAKLLKYQNVGSSFQYARRKKKASKKRRNVDNDELVSFMNTPEYGIDPMYAEDTDLMSALDALMRGDRK